MTLTNRKLSSLILSLAIFVISCTGLGKYPAGHRHVTRFNATDTLLLYSIDLYARVPATLKSDVISLIVDITSPEGKRYRDTLSLPVPGTAVHGISSKSGRWSDLKWRYRDGVNFSQTGNWSFAVVLNDKEEDSPGTGEMGVIIRKR